METDSKGYRRLNVKEWKTVKTDSKGKAVMDDITLCFPIVRQDYILPALRSLHKHTKSYSYKSIVVNMSVANHEFEEALYSLCDVVIRPHYNFGFAQGANLGMRLSPTPYVGVVNDDVLFCNDDWLRGIFETFERFPKAAAVNPQSPKEPGWGWGEPGHRYLIPKSFMSSHIKPLYDEDRRLMLLVKELQAQWGQRSLVTVQAAGKLQIELDIARKAFQETQDKLEALVLELSNNPSYIEALITEKNWAVVDAFAAWCSVFRADKLTEIGLFDERFSPGGSEDYTWMYDCYSRGYRALSTSRSYVNHFWGRTKDTPGGFSTALPLARPHWNRLSTKGFGDSGLFSPDCSVWGEDWSTRVDPVVYRAPL